MNKAAQSILIAVGVFLALGAVANAQTVKKYITPDGKTVYSDSPVPGAREVGEIKAPPKLGSGSSPPTQGAARSEAQQVEALDKRLQQQATQRESIAALEDKLEQAKKTLADGKEPLPGERKGTAGGASRLTDAYWDRQKANQQAVENAQHALDNAIAAQKQ